MYVLKLHINKLIISQFICFSKPGLFLLIIFLIKDTDSFCNKYTMQFRIEYVYRSARRIFRNKLVGK